MIININEIEADLLKTLLDSNEAATEAQHYHKQDPDGAEAMIDGLRGKIDSALESKTKRLIKRLYPDGFTPGAGPAGDPT